MGIVLKWITIGICICVVLVLLRDWQRRKAEELYLNSPYGRLSEFQNDSMARAKVDADIKMALSIRKVMEWNGLNNNNVIITVNTESAILRSEALDISKRRFKQSKKYQNVFIYFYTGGAPEKIKAPEYTSGGLTPAFEEIERSRPYMTVMVLGDSDYSVYGGFYGM